VDAGNSIEEVAARLHLTPLTVQRRLKLANVAPEFIAHYRAGELTLEHLMALAVTDDHEKQRSAWERTPPCGCQPQDIRALLNGKEVSARDPLARYVTVKSYEKAGGHCRSDLFSDENDVYLCDPELLRELAQKKLERAAEKLKGEALAWIDIWPQADYADRAGYRRVHTVSRPPTDAELQRLQEIDHQLAELRGPVSGALTH
jgi:ParB family chromosome partitioning protein